MHSGNANIAFKYEYSTLLDYEICFLFFTNPNTKKILIKMENLNPIVVACCQGTFKISKIWRFLNIYIKKAYKTWNF